MDKNICSSCGTENEHEYKYCKNCGTEIAIADTPPKTEFTSNADFNSAGAGYTQNTFPNGIITDTISGIPSDEVAVFVGKKGYSILPKFSKMEMTNSKISWCWPAAIFGYLFGPIGAACWFFYRKMYKPAVILSVIGAFITVLTTVMSGGMEIDFTAALEAIQAGNMNDYFNALGLNNSAQTLTTMISGLINEITNILSCVLCGMFGFYIYKNHCIEKINSYRAFLADVRYYKLGLASIGGVSGGMVVLGIVIMILSSNIAEIIATILQTLIK